MKEEPEEGEEKPTPEQRLADAVRDAKLAVLKVRDGPRPSSGQDVRTIGGNKVRGHRRVGSEKP